MQVTAYLLLPYPTLPDPALPYPAAAAVCGDHQVMTLM